MAVVEPGLDVSGSHVCGRMDVEVSGSVQVGDRDDAMHDSFERGEPVVELIVETLGAQPREVCDKEATTFWAFGQPTYSDQLRPDAVVRSCEPARCVGVARSSVSADFPVVRLVVAGKMDVGPAELVVCFVVIEGFVRKLSLHWAVGDSWHRTDRLCSAASGGQGVIVWFDVVADETG